VVEKSGIDLPSLDELLPFSAAIFIDAIATAVCEPSAETAHTIFHPDSGPSIGRALRLRIESLLI
jgi:hypothetical protein